ncbi:phosphopentomutase [Pseudooceanicola algae]|uniref:Phosphopentomutase n=1 Tax=Pseudooceanicola algae TaxID=1537215 RepID=A0A418SHA7_9RHOB|nr:phosphopentomutase [Pseudooceanicola algae]QPM90374.1 Phosphopentomutase [Pseudooceanicola algae]
MSRAFLVVMDSVGIGGAPDAGSFFNAGLPDTGANTLAHIAQACAEQGRSGPLHLPNLVRLGLGAAAELATQDALPGLGDAPVSGRWAAAAEVSPGKDTPSGHWELAGVPVPWDWTYFPNETPAFPADLTAEVCRLAGTDGILGNCHASGTNIIADLGAEHMRTGWPICYTSADSVFQIAAHEDSFGNERLQKLCRDLAPRLHAMRIGRVISRPFTGRPGDFQRTTNRRDYSLAPPAPTLCDWVQGAGRSVHGVGKIGDIFSMQGIDDVVKGADADLMDHLDRLVDEAEDGSLTFTNFVEFDSLYGHRRDISGYASALEWFDGRIGKVIAALRPGDLLVITADHGNDPSWSGSDHTRERVPVLMAGGGTGSAGLCDFVDVAATVAAHLGVPNAGTGRSLL